MFTPFRLRQLELKNRIVVSPMAQYRAVDGTPTDWHFVHYAERAKGGAGLISTEMTCVTPEGRITPGCTGLYSEAHAPAWRRIVDFIHAETDAKVAIQLGHSGPKGSTQLGWEGAGLAGGQLGDPGAVAAAVVAGQSGAPRDDAGRHGRGVRCLRTCHRNGRTGGLRYAGAALRPRLLDVGLHHPAQQPSPRRLWRLAREPHALSARGLACGAPSLASGKTDFGAHLGARLGGGGRQHPGRCG